MNFTDILKKKKISLSGKVVELQMQRDLFGQLLSVSLQKELNIDKVLTYPLTPVPLSMCHIDGTICKTLLKLLEMQFQSEPPKILM